MAGQCGDVVAGDIETSDAKHIPNILLINTLMVHCDSINICYIYIWRLFMN